MNSVLRAPAPSLAATLLAFALLGVACGGSSANQPTPHSFSPDTTLEVDWRVELVDPGIFTYEPTELGRVSLSDDGYTAFVGTSEGRMVSVDTTSGRVNWQFDIGEPIDGTPVYDDGQLFFGASDGRIYALSAGGGLVWDHVAVGNLDSAPAVSDSEVVFASANGDIVSLDRATGNTRWSAGDDDPILRVTRGLYPGVKGQNSPTIDGSVVCMGGPTGRHHALDSPPGAVVWTVDLANGSTRHADQDEPVAVADGSVYASSFNGGLYAINAVTGSVRWRADLRGATAPVLYRDQLLTTTVDGSFVSLDRMDGSITFRVRLDDRAPGRIAMVGDYAVVPTTQGALYVLDAAAPAIHARFVPTDGFASVVAGPGGRLVALDNRGVLYGLTLRYR